MKVNRYLMVIVFVLALLMAGNSASAGTYLLLRQVSSVQADVIPPWDVIPLWAMLPSTTSPLGEGEAGGGPIEPELLRALREAESGEVLRVIVHLHEQADVEATAGGAVSATEADASPSANTSATVAVLMPITQLCKRRQAAVNALR